MQIQNNSKSGRVAIIGGDARMICAALCFAESGFDTSVYGNGSRGCESPLFNRVDTLDDALYGSSAVVLPLPVARETGILNTPFYDRQIGIAEIIAKRASLTDNATLYGGLFERAFGGRPPEDSGYIYDYAVTREFTAENAKYTAEGALALAVFNTPKALARSQAAIFGCGKIGKCLMHLLLTCRSSVVVFSRNPRDRDFIEDCGCRYARYDSAADILPSCDLLFNTVPDAFVAGFFGCIRDGGTVIELAGVSSALTSVIPALSLPSRFSPASAGELIFRSVLAHIKEVNR